MWMQVHISSVVENSAEGLGYRREHCWRYIVSVFENTLKNLVTKRRAQLECSIHNFQVVVEATCLYFNPWRILNETTEPPDLFGIIPKEPWHTGKPDCIIQLNCTEVPANVSYKTIRTWQNFNNRGTKIIISEELWLIASSFKSFANESMSIIKNNLDLCKHFEIYLI